MRITRYILMAAMSASVLLSCTKVEEGNTSGASENPQERIITISYAGTRTSLNEEDLSVDFEADDEILVAQKDGQAPAQSCKVKVIGGSASFTTTLQGELIAVYPASAAKVSGNTINENDSFAVPAFQSGRFKDADICTATISAAGTSAVFTTQVSILRFYVDESIGVQSILVSSEEGEIADDSGTITVSLENSSFESLADQTDDPDGRICYVAVKPMSTSTVFSFESSTTSQEQNERDVNGLFLTSRDVLVTELEQNTIYNAFLPYYIGIDLDGDSKVDQRWAYCNIGAFLPEESGDYFMWGEVKGHKSLGNNSDYAFVTDFEDFEFDESRYNMTTLNRDKGFADCNIPYYDEGDFSNSKYFIEDGGNVTLELEDDAANIIWGSGWRVPTYEEFVEYLGEDVVEYVGDDFTHRGILFPAAGCGDGMTCQVGEGDYWSSSLCNIQDWLEEEEVLSLYAFSIYFCDEECEMFPASRSQGSSIRPIFDASLLPGVDGISGTLDPMGKVDF